MVRLLECQKKALKGKLPDTEELRLFAIALICSLLETFETDLTGEELAEIARFARDWCRK